MISKKFVLLFSMVLILLTGSLPAQPAFRVTGKKIISLPDQYLIAARWSPDGQTIAAAGKNYGSIRIYNCESALWKKIVEANAAGWDFDWSPDSRKIAFRANITKKRRKQTAIKIVDVITGNVEQIIDYTRNIGTPRWITSDIVTFSQDDQIKTMSVTQKTAMQPAQSSSQQNICLFSNTGFYIKKANQTVKLLEPLKGQTFDVCFAPDAELLVFGKPGGKIYTLRESINKVQLIGRGEMPAWSPDGKFIVFANPKDDGYKILSSDILIVDTNGENIQQLTTTNNETELRPHWSPDGKQIVCDSNGKIIIIRLETTVN